MDLCFNLLKSEPEKNLVLSSVNVEHAFAILATAAANKTRFDHSRLALSKIFSGKIF